MPNPPVPISPARRRAGSRAARRLRGSRRRVCVCSVASSDFAERIFCSCSASLTTTRRTSPMTATSILRSASACAASRPRSGVQSAGRPNCPSWLKRARQLAPPPRRSAPPRLSASRSCSSISGCSIAAITTSSSASSVRTISATSSAALRVGSGRRGQLERANGREARPRAFELAVRVGAVVSIGSTTAERRWV